MLAEVSIRTSSVVIKEIIEASHQAFKHVHEISLEENKQFLSKTKYYFCKWKVYAVLLQNHQQLLSDVRDLKLNMFKI